MWMFGNELNQPTKWNVPAAFSMIKEITKATHDLEGPDNWHPVTTALIDGNTAQTIKDYDDSVDVWSYQSYRGVSFYGLINQTAAATKKPLLMTEYGIDSYDSINMKEDQDMQVTVSTKLFNEVVQAAKDQKLAGEFYFKYIDDWWKFGSAIEQDNHGWNAGGFPDKKANEEWFGLYKLTPVSGSLDKLTPKKMATALASLHEKANPFNTPDSVPNPTKAPTTEPPTTKAPTKAPTTKAPTTKPPTTKAPTTKPPTTKPPTTKAPTTKAPTTKPPTTKAPTTKAPTTKAPTTKPPTTKAPTTKAPTTKPPTTKAPTTKAPTTKAPNKAPTTKPPTTKSN
jgi:hypothetical protein